MDFQFRCSSCGETRAADIAVYACNCGEPLSPVMPDFDPEAIDAGDRSVWRYADLLPVHTDDDYPPIRLGEGGTPQVPLSLVGMPVHFKLEFMQPTGSYKDRGSAILATALTRVEPRLVVEDSSGNAGASMAAYLSRANISLQLYMPGTLTPGALRQATAYGATIDQTAESREEAATLARDAATKTQFYASHIYSPYFMAGVVTMAYEIWESLDRQAPDNLVLPVGQGILLLGLHYGFRQLLEAGQIDKLPRIFGVQARDCAPVYEAFNRGQKRTHPVPVGQTQAYGVAVPNPPRGAEVLSALRGSDGAMLTVSDVEIARAQALMANMGWYVEPTAAVAVAGVVKLDKQIEGGETIVVPLTGNGLKA